MTTMTDAEKLAHLEKVRAEFELAVGRLKERGRADFPLAPMIINGHFHHYMDSDTDSAWIGYFAGWQNGRTALKQELKEKPNENPQL